MKPVAIDLCCGRGGWTRGLQAAGFYVVGVDVADFPTYPGDDFIRADVRTIDLEFLKEAEAQFVVASTPCPQFSLFSFKCFFPNAPYPAEGVELFNHVREICERSRLPYVMENVRAAQQFVGRAVNHYGSFYLWGNAVPALIPSGKGTKNLKHIYSTVSKKHRSAIIAEIPFELSELVGRSALNILEADCEATA